jgi:ribosomal protein S12 methylthiotransferase
MAALGTAGWGFVADPEAADVIIINTCSFIKSAVEESRRAIEEALAEKSRRPGKRVVVAGCLVGRCGRALQTDYPGVDLFLAPGRIPALPRALGSVPLSRWLGGSRGYRPARGAPRFLTTGNWAYLKISDGCDNRCGYCLIPSIRGGHRSRSPIDIAAEAAGLVSSGVTEINIVGQDITRWSGRDGEDIVDLIRSLSSVVSPSGRDYRIRLLYLHPARVDGRLVREIAVNPRVLPYVDVPIQHADDRILAAMNRGYTRRLLGGLWERLRRGIPGVALRTTVMVGYPGEGRSEFRRLLDFLADHPFENLGAFVFSPQDGTPAARLPGRVAAEEARERFEEVMSRQADMARKLWSARVGNVTEAFLQSPSGKRGRWIGRTAWQAPEVDGTVIVRGKGAPGEIVPVRITGHEEYDLEADRLVAPVGVPGTAPGKSRKDAASGPI